MISIHSPVHTATLYHQLPPPSKELLPPELCQSSVTGYRISPEFEWCVDCNTLKESYPVLNLNRSAICMMAFWPIRGFRRATAGRGSPLSEQPCMTNLRPINRARETLVCTHLLSAGPLCDQPHPACALRPDISGARVPSFNRLPLRQPGTSTDAYTSDQLCWCSRLSSCCSSFETLGAMRT